MGVNSFQHTGSSVLRSRALAFTVGFGILSALLYTLLFYYADGLVILADATRQDNKLYAIVPLAMAMVFFFIHDAFTEHFWNLVGLKTKR